MGITGLAIVGVTPGAYRRISHSYSQIRKEMKKLSPKHIQLHQPTQGLPVGEFCQSWYQGRYRIDLSEGKWWRIKTVGDHNS